MAWPLIPELISNSLVDLDSSSSSIEDTTFPFATRLCSSLDLSGWGGGRGEGDFLGAACGAEAGAGAAVEEAAGEVESSLVEMNFS